MINQQSDIMDVIRSISENRQKLQDLEVFATVQWGELYWLNAKFQNSDIATLMERHNADINYYLHQFNSSKILLN